MNYFLTKLFKFSNNVESLTKITDLHMTKALQSLSGTDMQWIGNIPVESLIKIRKENAMDEIRSILTKDISSLIDTNPTNFNRTHDQVFDNISESNTLPAMAPNAAVLTTVPINPIPTCNIYFLFYLTILISAVNFNFSK